MDGRRRSLEIDETLADVLESRAAAKGLSVDGFLSELVSIEGEIAISPDDLAELNAISDEWDRSRMGVPFEEVDAWMKSWGTDDERPAPKARRL